MKIVVNYLKEVEELFKEGKIDFIDYFKLYSLNEDLSGLEWCIQHRPVMFHGIIGKASTFGEMDLVESTDVEKTKDILMKTKTPYLSGHICTKNKNQSKEQTLEALSKNIEEYKKIFGKEIALENIPYREYYNHCLYLLDPELISKIVYNNNCMFLFDISHARKAAMYLNMPFEEYVAKLPMDKVIEFHMAGMFEMLDGTKMDYHGKLNEEDYKFLEEAIRKYPTLQYITLEYGSYLPKEKLNLLAGINLPLADFESVNPIVKTEVYEQLIRIKDILEISDKHTSD